MKRLTILSILFISLGFIVPIQVLASTNAGVGPSSFLYFFDTTFEKIGLFFTFDSEKKARKALEYADERLAEVEESANENKPKAVEKAIEDYEKKILFATEKSKEIDGEEKTEELLNTVSENTAKHQEVLAGVLEKVPEEAREAIVKAIEISKKGQEKAMEQIAELQKEVGKLKEEIKDLKNELEEKDQTEDREKEEKPEVNDEKENEQATEIEKLKEEIEVPKKTPATTPSQQKSYVPVADRQDTLQTNQAPVTSTNISQTGELPSTTIETWEQLEAKYFSSADLKGWISLIITNSLGEKRYYRKENNQWVRKNSEFEASQPYINSQNNLNKDNLLNTLLKMYDEQIEERRRQTEVALQQLEVERQEREAREDEKNKLLAPFQSKLDQLKATEKELGCGSSSGPLTMDQIIGAKAQQCKVLWADMNVVMADMGIIIAQYSPPTNTISTPTLNFSTQKSVLGQHYEFYHDGYGSGSIYNTSNPADSYKIYCSYGRCDIYGQ